MDAKKSKKTNSKEVKEKKEVNIVKENLEKEKEQKIGDIIKLPNGQSFFLPKMTNKKVKKFSGKLDFDQIVKAQHNI